MSRVRPRRSAPQSRSHKIRQTAAAHPHEGGGCLSLYALAPLSVLVLGGLFAILVISRLSPAGSGNPTGNNPGLAQAESASVIAPLFTPEVQFWAPAIQRWSAAAALDPNLVATVMQIESCGDAYARSSAGALGLFQVMPDHFIATDNPLDPDTNAARALSYLRSVFESSNHDIFWSLAAYNGGPGEIGLTSWAWPAETVRYVYWGSGIYSDALMRRADSPRLEEWLAAGGADLCRSAHQLLNLP